MDERKKIKIIAPDVVKARSRQLADNANESVVIRSKRAEIISIIAVVLSFIAIAVAVIALIVDGRS